MAAVITAPHHIKGIRPSLAVMEELGFSTEQCLEGTGITKEGLDNPKVKITLKQELAFNQNLLNISGDPLIGLKLGEAYHPQVYGMIGYAMYSADDLRQALAITSSYGDLTFTLFKLENYVTGEIARFTLRPKLKLTPDLLRLFSDRDVSAALCAFSDVLGERLPLRKIIFAHDKSKHQACYQNYFGCPVEFGQGYSELQFDVALLDKTLPQKDTETSAICQQQCQLLMAKLSSQSNFVDEVRQMILSIPGFFPDADYLARKLNISTRTLHRRLKQENSGYQALLNEIRYSLAREYLETTAISLEEISDLLGYSDPGNFSRAFKGWSKLSPRNWRQTHSDS